MTSHMFNISYLSLYLSHFKGYFDAVSVTASLWLTLCQAWDTLSQYPTSENVWLWCVPHNEGRRNIFPINHSPEICWQKLESTRSVWIRQCLKKYYLLNKILHLFRLPSLSSIFSLIKLDKTLKKLGMDREFNHFLAHLRKDKKKSRIMFALRDTTYRPVH